MLRVESSGPCRQGPAAVSSATSQAKPDSRASAGSPRPCTASRDPAEAAGRDQEAEAVLRVQSEAAQTSDSNGEEAPKR
eukprot:7158786-Pyramimonas_sp.AAC.1